MATELAIRLRADTAQVIAGLNQVIAGFDKLQAEGKITSQEVRALQGAMRDVGAAAREGQTQALNALRGIATDATAARGALGALTATTGDVRGATANMSAQFMDIGMMMASGQSPFLLAIQQGTQVAQVLGQTGAAGAAGVLKGALMSVLSPTTLLTIAIIGGVAALGQWAMGALGANENTQTLADSIKELEEAHKAASEAAAAAGQSNEELTAQYGAQAEGVRELLQLEAQLAAERAERARAAIGSGVMGTVTGGNGWFDGIVGDRGAAVDFFGLTTGPNAARSSRFANERLVDQLFSAADAMQIAEGLDAQIAAAEELLRIYTELADAAGGRTEAEAEGMRIISEALRGMIAAREEERAAIAKSAEQAVILDDFLEMAANSANAIASADIAGNINSALGPAAALAERMWTAARGMAVARAQANANLEAMAFEFSPGGQALNRFGSRAPGGTAAQNDLAERNRPIVVPVSRGGGGGGGGKSERELQLERVQKELEKTRLAEERLAQTRVDSVTSSIAGSLADMATGAKSAGDAFRDMGETIINTIARMAAQNFANAFISPLIDGLFGAIGPSLSFKPLASGGVVNGPTLFGYGGGKIGLMGEAGPEAIMPMKNGGILTMTGDVLPLGRDARGALAVRAFADGGVVGGSYSGGGGAGPRVVVNMQNNGTTAQVTETRQEGNTTFLRIMTEQIKQAVAADIAQNGVVGQAVGGRFGLRMSPR